jgi:gamma-glutamyl hercynylcysteine S-oxide synthase
MKMVKRLLPLLLTAAAAVFAQDTAHRPEENQIPAPRDAGDFAAWLRDMKIWRAERLTRMGYSDAEYTRPELQWAQRDFVQPQMMAEERYFYDPAAGEVYRRPLPGRSREALRRHRQRADLAGVSEYRHRQPQPVGPGSRSAGRHCRLAPDGGRFPSPRRARLLSQHAVGHRHARRGPCRIGTRRRSLMAEIGADGVNGDTFNGMPRAYRTASDRHWSSRDVRAGRVAQRDEMLMWNNQSWGYWNIRFAPMVSKLKWLEPRHMINVVRPLGARENGQSAAAFFNGVGYRELGEHLGHLEPDRLRGMGRRCAASAASTATSGNCWLAKTGFRIIPLSNMESFPACFQAPGEPCGRS